jgi:hypothetical protein
MTAVLPGHRSVRPGEAGIEPTAPGTHGATGSNRRAPWPDLDSHRQASTLRHMSQRMTPDVRQRYDHLAKMVFVHGERFDKQHGSWIRLRLTDDVYLTMDSWSKAIWLRSDGARFRNPVTGFGGRLIERLGIDFGTAELYATPARLESIIRATKSALRTMGGDSAGGEKAA